MLVIPAFLRRDTQVTMKRQVAPNILQTLISSASMFNRTRLVICAFTITLHFFCAQFAEASDKFSDVPLFEIAPTQIIETDSGQFRLKTLASVKTLQSLEPFTLGIEIEGQADFTLSSNELAGYYGDFYFALQDENITAKTDAITTITRKWKAYPNKRGAASLPPIPFYLTTKDNEVISVKTQPITFEIPAIEVVGSIEDVKEDHSLIKTFPLLWLVVCILALALVALFWKSRKHRKVVAGEVDSIILEDPYKKAIRLLEELRQSRAYQENKIDFYTTIVAILRCYLSERFTLNAEESTTQEILATIDAYVNQENLSYESFDLGNQSSFELTPAQFRDVAYNVLKEPEIRTNLARVLDSVDLVKFARHSTTFEEASKLFSQIQKLVESAERLLNERRLQYQKTLESLMRQSIESRSP